MKYITILSFAFILNACISNSIDYKITNKYGKDGVVDTKGNLLVKHSYNKIYPFNNKNQAIVSNFKNKYGAIDINNHVILDIIYDSIGQFYGDYASIQIDGKFGLINNKFKVLIKPQYDMIEDFVEDTTIIRINGKVGCLNKELKLKLKPEYTSIYPSSSNFRKVKKDNKWGYIDNKCNIIIPAQYDYIEDFNTEDMTIAKKGDKEFRFNTKGELLIF